ncbi:hypothetical protein KVR01_011515 [Diaporthe batatas]|uniref:uncharacterized protein n=1 Tax=Diaporthe batatas TaxID=748121 RepID=UPI001D04479B|nr:uncharacterized protein KVR01_011515 [Diaporthe batatas]KAG8158393.1 hypothetical protein KVR01_011515 [Diaporthe batatas]
MDEPVFNAVRQALPQTAVAVYATLAQTGVPTEDILASTVFNYRMGASRTSPMQGVDVKFLEYSDAKSPFDLVISVDEFDDGTGMLTFSLQDYLGRCSRHRTGNRGPSPAAGTLSKIIDGRVKKHAEDLAVKDIGGRTLTYLQLSKKASATSARLSEASVTCAVPVCVLLEPGVVMISTIPGILGCGAAYVRTDETLAEILQELGSPILIHNAATAERARHLQNRRPVLAQRVTPIPLDEPRATGPLSAPEGVAMILYTSGSTSKPKGIPLTHANIRTPILGVSERWSRWAARLCCSRAGRAFTQPSSRSSSPSPTVVWSSWAMPLPGPSLVGGEADEQLTECEARLKDVCRSGVGLGEAVSTSNPIRRHSDFFSIGGHLLLLLPLKSEIHRVFGVDVTLPGLFQTSTLELMAARFSGPSDSKLVRIDWDKETDRLGRRESSQQPEGIAVLLTGATGFLGTAILGQLVAMPLVAHVHCCMRLGDTLQTPDGTLTPPKPWVATASAAAVGYMHFVPVCDFKNKSLT